MRIKNTTTDYPRFLFLLRVQQRIFQKNHPKLTVDEYKVSETDLPSSQKHKLRRENSQDKDQARPHPTTVRQKSILSVLSYTLANVIAFI